MKTPPFILIVDDEPSIRYLLVDLLQDDGDRIIAVSNAEDALRVVGKQCPDLIICDRKMPGMSGLQLLERLRSEDTTSEVPFIFFTGSYDDELVVEATRLGVSACLPKPFDIFELRNCIRRTIATK